MLLALAPFALGWLGWRRLERGFRPANAELALFEGLELVRGPKRVLAVTAHPDDLEALAGGTLRLMALSGSEIHVAVLSDGRQQSNWRSNLGQIRKLEEEHAANILGYSRVHYLGFRDLSLSRIPELGPALESLWDNVKPEVLFTFDPSFPEPYIVHPDHLTAGRIVLDIVRTRPDVAVYFYGTSDTSVIVDISPVIHDKSQAVLAHRSQLQAPPAVYSLLMRVYAWLRGRPVQLKSAEGFRVLSLENLTARSSRGQWIPGGRSEKINSPPQAGSGRHRTRCERL